MEPNLTPPDSSDNALEITQEEFKLFARLTTEQRAFYLYEVRCSRGKEVAKALVKALFLFLDSEK